MTAGTPRPQKQDPRVPRGLLGFLFLFPALFALGAGIKVCIASLKNPRATEITYADFSKLAPKNGWYTIKNVTTDVTKSVYWEQNGVCIDVFAPVSDSKVAVNSAVDLYVEISDSKTLSAFQDMKYARRDSGENGARKFVRDHASTFLQKRDISGLVSFGHRDPMGEWSKAGLDAANITLIEDRWKPNLPGGLAGAAFGLISLVLCIGAMIADWRRR